METTNIVDLARPDEMTDALTELLRTGAQKLIATAVEAEFASYLGTVFRLAHSDGSRGCRAQRSSPGATSADRHWPCERAHSQGSIQGRHTGDLPLSPGAALRAQNQDVGSSFAVALPQRHFQWRDGFGSQGFAWPRGQRIVGEYDFSAQA